MKNAITEIINDGIDAYTLIENSGSKDIDVESREKFYTLITNISERASTILCANK